MKGHPVRYSADEMVWLEQNRAMVISDYARAFAVRFGRAVPARNLHALRKRKGWSTGRTGQFEKGSEPFNKGKKFAPGRGGNHPNAQRHQFKKGQMPHTYRGPGYERIDSKDGYVILIVAETNPWSGAKTRPVLKHRWLWEKINGPVPEGYVLKSRDGNKTNTDPSNWKLVSRSLLPRLNGKYGRGYDAAPAELKPTIMAVAELEQEIAERRTA